MPGSEAREVKVWDLPTRLFHWLLVLAVAIGAVSGYVAPEWWMALHVWSGYAVVGLIVFRLVWGVFGSEYSRVASFTYPPRAIVEHLRGIVLLRPAHCIGHTPAGAAMIFALAAVLIGIVVSGLLVLGGEEKQGPLAAVTSYGVGNAAKAAHEILVFVLLAMVAAHVAGVVLESLLERENLVTAMITGRKRLPADAPRPRARPARPIAATLTLVAIGVVVAAAVAGLSRLPDRGVRALALNQTYAKECGACHYAFHPSLLPRASWMGILDRLGEHFGEDASLADAPRRDIAAWLAAHAGETWDTEAANRFRAVAPDMPYRITATPYWIQKHRAVGDAVFKRGSVGGKVNCIACHRDADTGRFDDHAIAIPKEKQP